MMLTSEEAAVAQDAYMESFRGIPESSLLIWNVMVFAYLEAYAFGDGSGEHLSTYKQDTSYERMWGFQSWQSHRSADDLWGDGHGDGGGGGRGSGLVTHPYAGQGTGDSYHNAGGSSAHIEFGYRYGFKEWGMPDMFYFLTLNPMRP
jgi:hypothetical protein